MKVNWKGNPGNKSLMDASLEVSLAYHQYQERSYFTPLSFHSCNIFGHGSSSYLGGRPCGKCLLELLLLTSSTMTSNKGKAKQQRHIHSRISYLSKLPLILQRPVARRRNADQIKKQMSKPQISIAKIQSCQKLPLDRPHMSCLHHKTTKKLELPLQEPAAPLKSKVLASHASSLLNFEPSHSKAKSGFLQR